MRTWIHVLRPSMLEGNNMTAYATSVTRKKSVWQKFKESFFIDILSRMLESPSAKIGAILFAILVIMSAFAPLFTHYGVNEMDLNAMFATPSLAHLFGTDQMGRDIFTRILYGGRYSLSLGILAALFGAMVGVVIGSIAGFFGGKVEMIIMRLLDVWSALPGILLCILISAALGSGFVNTIIALAVGSIPNYARMIRGQILQERSKEYLEAAEEMNCSNFSIMFRHLLPNVISPIIVQTTMSIGQTITQAATLSYIGLGVQPPTPEWGAMLSDARAHILKYPHMIIFPGLFIMLIVLAINLVGDGLRDAIDPKLRK